MSVVRTDPETMPPQRFVVALAMTDKRLRQRVADAVDGLVAFVRTDLIAGADVLVADAMEDGDVPIVVIGPHATIAAALADGAAGGLLPTFNPTQLAIVLEAVTNGMICAEVPPARRRGRSKPERHALADEAEEGSSDLTAREAEVLALLTTGAGNKQIARTLDISVHTVKFHVAAIIAKFGASGRTDAVVRALRQDQSKGPSWNRCRTMI